MVLATKLVSLSLAMLLCVPGLQAQSGDVTARLTMAPMPGMQAKKKMKIHSEMSETVLWLTPADGPAPQPVKGSYRMVQKNKQFSPRLLVIPTGSSVSFPNQDPFFHNVFSMYNGQRFDLGLYEAGSSRSIQFDREGVSYLFCNIHPEMGAIILTVSTPYYAVVNSDDTATIHNVPPGRYRLHLWSQQFEAPERVVQVTARGAALGSIEMTPATDLMTNHKNKFGEDYPMQHTSPY